jgi:SHS2 domain-containing protein
MAKMHRAFGTTADVGVVSFGADQKEAFEEQAKGMFSLMADLRQVKLSESFDLETSGADREGLLVAWLNELLFLYDTQGVFLREFEITEMGETRLKATVRGERIDPGRHTRKTEVKAVTWHMLEVAVTVGGFRTRVVYDI